MYFVCYAWRSKDGQVVFMNKVLDTEHPLQWLARTQAGDPKAHCRLVSWQRLNDQEAGFAKAIVSDP